MKPWDVYALYLSLKLHFTRENYDARKYHFRTSVNPSSFMKRRDKYHFAKLANKLRHGDKIRDYLVANILQGKVWIGDMTMEIYNEWLSWKESHSYKFREDMDLILDRAELLGVTFERLLKPIDGEYPELVYMYLEEQISLETITIINRLTDFIRLSNISDIIFWPDFSLKVYKYTSILELDYDRLARMAMKQIKDRA